MDGIFKFAVKAGVATLVIVGLMNVATTVQAKAIEVGTHLKYATQTR
jgi:hypothetical protein